MDEKAAIPILGPTPLWLKLLSANTCATLHAGGWTPPVDPIRGWAKEAGLDYEDFASRCTK